MAESPPDMHAIATRLEAAFEAIRVERMQDVPILNAALCVEAVGLRAWNGCVLGALVTPWFINLVVLPGEGPWRRCRQQNGARMCMLLCPISCS